MKRNKRDLLIGKNTRGGKTIVSCEFKETENGLAVSFCVDFWLRSKRDCYMCGQCLDEILTDEMKEYEIPKEVCEEIVSLWKKHHLNDMKAGTSTQENILKMYDVESYDHACEILENNGKLFDNGYRYGTSWLFQSIPTEDIRRIETIFNF